MADLPQEIGSDVTNDIVAYGLETTLWGSLMYAQQ